MVDPADPAYRFVDAANRKEAANARTIEQRRTRKPSPRPSLVMALILGAIAVQDFVAGEIGYGMFFLCLMGFNLWVAIRVLRGRQT